MEDDKRKNYEDFFEALEDMVDQAIEEMERSMRSLLRSDYFKSFERPKLYGFSIQMDEKGIPKITKFGDSWSSPKGVRTPYYDQYVDKNRNQLVLIFELPGVEREDIKVKTSPNKLILEAKRDDREYRAEVDLETEVDPSSAISTFKNGLLTINVKLKEHGNEFTDISIV
ncbi:MAG: Hsp20/alpha crystallin family protein [Nitrososphaeria archaeon]